MDNDDAIVESSTFMMMDSRGPSEQSEYTALGLMIRIDGHVYAVDVRLLRSLKMSKLSTNEEGVERPASLLLNFTSCIFRIFSNYPDDSSKLEEAKSKLASLIQKNPDEVWKQGLFCLDTSTIDSPSTTSTRPKESQGSSVTIDVSEKENCGNSNKKTINIPAVVERLNKRRILQEEFDESMVKLDMITQQVPNLNEGDMPHYRQAAYTMMTAAADARGKSFATSFDVSLAAQHFESVAHDTSQNIEVLLEAFFPSKAPAPRQETVVDSVSMQDKVTEQMHKRQKVVTERANLILYPTRG